MLFASTRLTLVRELGIERFRESIFTTTKEELTKEGFDKHDKHVALEAPLTEEERSLGEVKRKEAEEGRGTNGRRSHVSSGVSMPVSEDALQALKELAEEKDNNLVQLVRPSDLSHPDHIADRLSVAENQHWSRNNRTCLRNINARLLPLLKYFRYRATILVL
jgi:LmbE family N-acetylglucosaminyl deacetylase